MNIPIDQTLIQFFIEHNQCRITDDVENLSVVYQLEGSEKLKNLLIELENSGVNFETKTENSNGVEHTIAPSKILPRQFIKFIFEPGGVKIGDHHFFISWKDMLRIKKHLINPPQHYYLIIHDVSSKDESNTHVNHYKKISSFLNLLIQHSELPEHSNKGVNDIVFLHKNRLDISPSYCESDLEFELDGFSILNSLLSSDEHKEQKSRMFKEALNNILVNIDRKNRLRYLLQNFASFSASFADNYNLFVSDFSFDKVREEYEEEKRKYISSLNESFSSVQTQMLGVPISLAVASFKFEPFTDTKLIISNIIIMMAIGLYCFFTYALIDNQHNTLDALRDEYKSHFGRLESQYNQQYEKIKDAHIQLNNRYDKQKRWLATFKFIIIMIAVIIICLAALNLVWNDISSMQHL